VAIEDEQGHPIHEAVDRQLAPDEAAVLHEKTVTVNRAIAALPGELREALLLFTVEEMSQAEIAKTLGCTAKAVEVRIYRARQALREALAREKR
jgi:RNA polymerase sigma-70 factor (ECF subfamily)